MARDPSFLHMDTWLANFKELLRWRFKMNFLYWVYFKFWNSWSLLRQVRELIIQYLRTFVGWGGVGGGGRGVSGRGVPMFFSQCRKTCFCSSTFLFMVHVYWNSVLVVKFQISVIYNFTMIRIFNNVPINVSISSNNQHFSIAVHTKITTKLWQHKRWK